MRFASSLRGLTATGFVLLALSGCGADDGVNPLPASASTAGTGAGGTTTPPTGGGTGDTGGTGGTGGGGGTTPPPNASTIVPTWYGVQANILQPRCVGCHGGSAPFAGLSWEVDQYATIVTDARMSTEITNMREVQPGDPNASYMYWKITGNPGILFARMPADGTVLDPALIAVIEQWIADGAPLGVPEDATPGGGGGGTPGFPVGSWMYVWSNTLTVCTACHSNTPSSPRCLAGGDLFGDCPPKGVVLTADNYNGVVNGKEVQPGDLNGSDLWDRVTDPDPDKRMPFGMDPLTPQQLDIIRNWILDGAPFCPAGEPLDACTP